MRSAFFSTPPLLLTSLTTFIFATLAHAENNDFSQNYQAPSRGFIIENGTVSGLDRVSAELYSGSGNLNTGGGIRLGLSNAELILNSNSNANNQNDLLLKWAMKDYKLNAETSHVINWSALGGISHVDTDTIDSFSFQFGASATIDADAASFTVTPTLVHIDINDIDDTYINLGLGAHVGVIDTLSGLFSLGAEAIITTQDDQDDLFAFGARWSYNERVNIDLIPLVLGGTDLKGLPGMVKLNIVF